MTWAERCTLAATAMLTLVAGAAWQVRAGGELVRFPETYR